MGRLSNINTKTNISNFSWVTAGTSDEGMWLVTTEQRPEIGLATVATPLENPFEETTKN